MVCCYLLAGEDEGNGWVCSPAAWRWGTGVEEREQGSDGDFSQDRGQPEAKGEVFYFLLFFPLSFFLLSFLFFRCAFPPDD